MTAGPDPVIEADVRARVAELKARIARAADRAGRDPSDVTLVGAAKRQPIERVAAAVRAGVSDLGHNYVQEAEAMREALEQRLSELTDGGAPARVRWRMIGHLQSNKAAAAVRVFDGIDSVDRLKLARAIDRRAQEAGRCVDIGIQVNLTGEAQKSGIPEAELPALLEGCGELECVRVVSLMTMPRASSDPDQSRAVFAQLRTVRDRLRGQPGADHLEHLSMGMSGDFEIAIEEGATLVRVGTALFGERAPRTEHAPSPPSSSPAAPHRDPDQEKS